MAETIHDILAEIRTRKVIHRKYPSPTLIAWADRIEAALANERQDWIDVNDRLPEMDDNPIFRESVENVLVYCMDGKIRCAYMRQFDDEPAFWVMQGRDGYTFDIEEMPIYWQPLPSPPIAMVPSPEGRT